MAEVQRSGALLPPAEECSQRAIRPVRSGPALHQRQNPVSFRIRRLRPSCARAGTAVQRHYRDRLWNYEQSLCSWHATARNRVWRLSQQRKLQLVLRRCRRNQLRLRSGPTANGAELKGYLPQHLLSVQSGERTGKPPRRASGRENRAARSQLYSGWWILLSRNQPAELRRWHISLHRNHQRPVLPRRWLYTVSLPQPVRDLWRRDARP